MAVFRQKKVGFKSPNKFTPVEGITSRVTSLKELSAKQKVTYVSQAKSSSGNGKRAAIKTIVEIKAKQMLESLKPYEKIYFEELLKEIKLNPGMSIMDISLKVARTLKAKNPSENYTDGGVTRLYQAGVKFGAIKLN